MRRSAILLNELFRATSADAEELVEKDVGTDTPRREIAPTTRKTRRKSLDFTTELGTTDK